MAVAVGYAVLDGTVPPDLVRKATGLLSSGSLKVTVVGQKYKEFEVPGVCYQIRDWFMAV